MYHHLSFRSGISQLSSFIIIYHHLSFRSGIPQLSSFIIICHSEVGFHKYHHLSSFIIWKWDFTIIIWGVPLWRPEAISAELLLGDPHRVLTVLLAPDGNVDNAAMPPLLGKCRIGRRGRPVVASPLASNGPKSCGTGELLMAPSASSATAARRLCN
jgi:hypothetical protein